MIIFETHQDLLSRKKFMLMGHGVTGRAVASFILDQTNFDLIIANSGDPSEWFQAQSYQGYEQRIQCCDMDDPVSFNQCLNLADAVMRSPGLDPRRFSQTCLGQKEVGEIELAYQFLKVQQMNIPIVAITGTNGKTTTVSMMKHVCDQSGIQAFLGGNVGTPFIQLFKEQKWQDTQVIILELSSFQTEQLDSFEADASAILNLSASHEERYEHADDYFESKLQLFDHTPGQKCFYLASNLNLLERLRPSFPFQTQFAISNELANAELKHHLLQNLEVIGEHNLMNAFYCYRMLESIGKKVEFQSFKGFLGVAYRLQKRPSVTGRPLFNDAKSTNQEATLTAVTSMAENFEAFALIMGGQLRSARIDFSHLFQSIPKGAQLYFFGEARSELARHAKQFQLTYHEFESLEPLLRQLKQTSPQDPLLFSPGFPSFDQFKNYVERGKSFDQLIEELKF